MTIVRKIENLARRFLWGVTDGVKNSDLVSWKAIYLPLELGGSGLEWIGEVIIALLCKWFWHLREDKLWVNLSKEKYGGRKRVFFLNAKRELWAVVFGGVLRKWA